MDKKIADEIKNHVEEDATMVNVRTDGESEVRMWVRDGQRTACCIKKDGVLWTILFDGEARRYCYGVDSALKETLDKIADKAWDEYRHLV